MLCRCVPLSFPGMRHRASLPAGTAWVGPKQSPGRRRHPGARASRPHAPPLRAAQFPWDGAPGQPAGGNGLGRAEPASWHRRRSSRLGEIGEAVPIIVRAGRPRSRVGLIPRRRRSKGRMVFAERSGGEKSSRRGPGRPAGPGSTGPSRACPPNGRPPPSGRRSGIPRPAPPQSPLGWLPLPSPIQRNT